MSVLLISMMIILYTFQSFLCKKYSESYPGKDSLSSPTFTVVSGLTVAVISLCFGGFKFDAQPLTVLLGIINAVILFAYNTCLIKASDKGAYSVLMVFLISGGILVPTFSAMFFGDIPSVWKIMCVIAIVVSVYMISKKPNVQKQKSHKTFIPLCIGLALTNGAYGSLLNIQQKLTEESQKDEMVAITFLVAAILSAVYLGIRTRKDFFPAFRQTKISLFYLLTCSLCAAFAINLLVYVLMKVDVTVLYTFDNSGVFLVSVLLSVVFLKEKLSMLNIIGCIIMCTSLVGVSLL